MLLLRHQGLRIRADAAHCAVLASFNATVHGNADGGWLTTPDRLADEPVLCQEPCRACPSSPRVSDLLQDRAWAIPDQALLHCVDELPEPPHLTPEAIDRVYYTRAYEYALHDEKPATDAPCFDDLLTAETSDLFDWLEEDTPEGGVHFSTVERGYIARMCAEEDSDESVYATPCASLSVRHWQMPPVRGSSPNPGCRHS